MFMDERRGRAGRSATRGVSAGARAPPNWTSGLYNKRAKCRGPRVGLSSGGRRQRTERTAAVSARPRPTCPDSAAPTRRPSATHLAPSTPLATRVVIATVTSLVLFRKQIAVKENPCLRRALLQTDKTCKNAGDASSTCNVGGGDAVGRPIRSIYHGGCEVVRPAAQRNHEPSVPRLQQPFLGRSNSSGATRDRSAAQASARHRGRVLRHRLHLGTAQRILLHQRINLSLVNDARAAPVVGTVSPLITWGRTLNTDLPTATADRDRYAYVVYT